MIPVCILIIEDEDDRAFMEELYICYHRLIYSTIKNIVSDQWAIEDIMQSALVKLIDKIPLLRARATTQRINYIITTAKNTALDYVRKNSRYAPDMSLDEDFDLEFNSSSAHEIEDMILKQEAFDALARVWEHLDVRSKYLLEGYYILEKTTPQLAKELGLKPESVRMALSRARKQAYGLIESKLIK